MLKAMDPAALVEQLDIVFLRGDGACHPTNLFHDPMAGATVTNGQKITLGEMRAPGIRGLLVYCSDYKFSRHAEISVSGVLRPIAAATR